MGEREKYLKFNIFVDIGYKDICLFIKGHVLVFPEDSDWFI
jgi:hypothetical protein